MLFIAFITIFVEYVIIVHCNNNVKMWIFQFLYSDLTLPLFSVMKIWQFLHSMFINYFYELFYTVKVLKINFIYSSNKKIMFFPLILYFYAIIFYILLNSVKLIYQTPTFDVPVTVASSFLNKKTNTLIQFCLYS